MSPQSNQLRPVTLSCLGMPDITPEVSAAMAAWGRKGGSARGGRKAEASRANGRRRTNPQNEQAPVEPALTARKPVAQPQLLFVARKD
jgi:hypothetical protein